MSKIENQKEEKEINNEQEENVEEEEPLDEETTKNLKNLTIDDNLFSAKENESSNKDGKKSGGKNKKNKRGQDFMDYAKTNGIDLKIEYEDITQNNFKNRDNRDNFKGKFQNNNRGTKPFGHQQNNQNFGNFSNSNNTNQRKDYRQNQSTQQTNQNDQNENQFNQQFSQSNENNNQERNFENTNERSNYQNQNRGNYKKNPNYQKKNYNNYNNQGKFQNQNNKNLNANKFDSMSGQQGGNNNYSQGGHFNQNYQNQFQNQGYHPNQMAYFQQMQQMQAYMQMNPQFFYQQMMMMNKQMPQMGGENADNSDQSVFESLEYYFSEENLNKDYYIRSKMDEDGFIEAKEILTFNKMKVRGVSLERIDEVLKTHPSNVVEPRTNTEGVLYLRNKDWESFKDKLVSLEELKQMRMTKKYMNNNNNFNQNQYFNNMQQGNFYGNPMHMNMNQQGEIDMSRGYPMYGNQYEMNVNMQMYQNNMGTQESDQ